MIKTKKGSAADVLELLENGYLVTITTNGVVPILTFEAGDEIHEDVLPDTYSFEEAKHISLTVMERVRKELEDLDEENFLQRYTSRDRLYEESLMEVSKAAIEAAQSGQSN